MGACAMAPPSAGRKAQAELGGLATALCPGSEERGSGERAIEPGPTLPVAEALLDPVEASERSTEVVDHVHERGLARARHHGTSVLELPVVREHDVEYGLGVLLGEALDPVDLAPNDVVPERDLAVEPALVRH